MTERRCSVCNIPESFVGNKVRIVMVGRKETMTRLICVLLASMFLASCAPSQESIQRAISQTQTAMPTPTATIIPTATPIPCTDSGWTNIRTYYKQFNSETPSIGASMVGFFDGLNNYKDKINAVEIDACTEHARQTLLEVMDSYILTMKLTMTFSDQDKITSAMTTYTEKLSEAKAELASLEILFDF